jgi:hypothetical protein
MVVFAPMANASVRTATAVKPPICAGSYSVARILPQIIEMRFPSSLARMLLDGCDTSESRYVRPALPPSRTHAGCHVPVDRHLEIRLQLLVQILFDLIATGQCAYAAEHAKGKSAHRLLRASRA